MVLPFVPDTSTTRRPTASPDNAPGSSSRVTRPPMIEPAPNPTRRDTRLATSPARTAAHAHARPGRLTVEGTRSPTSTLRTHLRATRPVVGFPDLANDPAAVHGLRRRAREQAAGTGSAPRQGIGPGLRGAESTGDVIPGGEFP